MSKMLKVAIVINSNMVKSFEYEIIKNIININECEVDVCSLLSNHPVEQNVLLKAYLKFDTLLNARGKNHISVKNINDLNIKRFVKLDELEEKKLDILINLSDLKLSDEIISSSVLGTWELRCGNVQNNPDLAGLFEVSKGDETTPVTLVKLSDSQNSGYVVDRFLSATHGLSPVRNRSDILNRAHNLVLKNIKRVISDKEEFLKQREEKLYFFKDRSLETPSFLDTFVLVSKLGLKNITSRVDKLFRKQQWSVYYAINEKDDAFNQNMSDFKEIPTPKEFFWADPFVMDKDDKSYIFFEEYVYKTHKGHLSVIEYDHKSGSFSDTKEILNTPYHLSYPFITEVDGEFYMIPEGSQDRDIKLYRAKNFPYEWEFIHTMMDNVTAVDTTIFYKDNRWWMFTNMAEEEGLSLNDELYIFYCDDFLKDEWIAHKQNPVVSSLQTSRPAGGILRYKDSYYRPSQNSVGWYGRATNFNKILTLTTEVYEEEFVSEITPDFIDGIYAVHTYNNSKKLTVIDGLKKIGRFV